MKYSQQGIDFVPFPAGQTSVAAPCCGTPLKDVHRGLKFNGSGRSPARQPRSGIRRARRSQRKSDQQMPKGDDPIERRTGVEFDRLDRDRRMGNRTRLNVTDGRAQRTIAGRCYNDPRQVGSTENRLAAAARLYAIAWQRPAMLATIIFMLGAYGSRAATAIG